MTERSLAGVAVLKIGAFGDRDHLGKNLDLFRHARPGAEEGIHGLLEIEQPEWQAQIARVQDLCVIAEAAAVFVMRIDEENAQVRPRPQDLAQDNGDAARLADTGGAENGKMLVEQFVDVDHRLNARILTQRSEMSGVRFIAVDQPQLFVTHQQGWLADDRIIGNAAREHPDAIMVTHFSEQIDLCDAGAADARLFGNMRDHADDHALAADDAKKLPDRRSRYVATDRSGKLDSGVRTADRKHAADDFALLIRGAGLVQGRGPARCIKFWHARPLVRIVTPHPVRAASSTH